MLGYGFVALPVRITRCVHFVRGNPREIDEAFADLVSQRAAARALHLVPHADLANFDPICTTAYIARDPGLLVWDMLYGMDNKLQPQRQMVESESCLVGQSDLDLSAPARLTGRTAVWAQWSGKWWWIDPITHPGIVELGEGTIGAAGTPFSVQLCGS
jgi:hypothetical protein